MSNPNDRSSQATSACIEASSGHFNDVKGQDALQRQPHMTKKTFYQQHFCRAVPPVPQSAEKVDSNLMLHARTRSLKITANHSQQRPYKFSWTSRGSICITIAVATTLLLTACIVTTQLEKSRNARSRARTMHAATFGDRNNTHPVFTQMPDPTNMPGFGNEFAVSQPPLRLGILTNFPDPAIHYEAREKTWYTYGTNDEAGILDPPRDRLNNEGLEYKAANIQLATSPDFRIWNLHDAASDPLPDPGAWTQKPKSSYKTTASRALPDEDEPITSSMPDQGSPQMPLADSHSRLVIRSSPGDTNKTDLKPPKPSPPNVWAPEIFKHPTIPSHYIMYYAAAHAHYAPTHCIGAATASTPLGPFTPVSTKPLICPHGQGGAIDPAVFVEPSLSANIPPEIYLLYKVDGNSHGHGGECGNTVPPLASTPIFIQRLDATGTALAAESTPVKLLDRSREDGPLVEAPALIKAGSTYFLFYSGGCTRNPDYTLRYATARSILGPYKRAGGGVNGRRALLRTGDYGLEAPGSAGVKFLPDADAGTGDPGSGDTLLVGPDGDGRNGEPRGRWVIAIHARVRTGWGGIRAVFTGGLEFDAEGGSAKIVPGL